MPERWKLFLEDHFLQGIQNCSCSQGDCIYEVWCTAEVNWRFENKWRILELDGREDLLSETIQSNYWIVDRSEESLEVLELVRGLEENRFLPGSLEREL